MKTTERVFRVNQWDVCYIRSIVESYDGTALVSTMCESPTHIRVFISPGCEYIINELMAYLSKHEGLLVEAVTI